MHQLIHSLYLAVYPLCDLRFSKSTKSGVLYEARTYNSISDEELKNYGVPISEWSRDKDGVINIITIKTPSLASQIEM